MRARDDTGLTLIEVMLVISLMGIISALGVFGWHSFQHANEQIGTAQRATSLLRSVSQRAISEDATFCVRFETDAKTVTLWRSACSTGQNMGQLMTAPGAVSFVSPTFSEPNGSTGGDIYFYARGAATPGSVRVARSGSAKAYTLSVSALTGHVSYA